VAGLTAPQDAAGTDATGLISERAMTDNKTQAGTSSAGAAAPRAGGGAGRRLVMANVIVATLLVVGLVVAVNYVTWWLDKKYDLKADLTEGRRYSFSERTKRMVDGIDSSVRLTMLFVPDDKNEEMTRQTRTVEELLRQYESQSIQVTAETIDMSEDVEAYYDLGHRLAATYAGEVTPYDEAIKAVVAFQRNLITTLADEATLYGEAAKTEGIAPVVLKIMAQSAKDLDHERQRHAKRVEAVETEYAVQLGLAEKTSLKARAGDLGVPDYTAALGAIARDMQWTASALDRIAAQGNQVARTEGLKLPEKVQNVLAQAEDRYRAVQQQMEAVLTPVADLKPLTLTKLIGQLTPGTVVIETAGEVRIAAYDSLWPPENRRDSREGGRAFAGESVITSLLLAMTMDQRPTAIFVNWGGQPVREAFGSSYSEIAMRLTRSGFAIENWDLMQSPKMPDLEGKGKIVLVLMPPEQPRQRFPMQMPPPPPSPASYEPIRKFVEQGGSAVFMLQLHMIGGPDLPYTDIVKAQGLSTDQAVLVLQSQELPNGEQQVAAEFYPNVYPSESAAGEAHRIAQAIQGFRGRFTGPVVLQPAEKLPAGTTVIPLVEATADGDLWGEVDLMTFFQTRDAKFDPGADKKGSFLLVAATERAMPAVAPTTDGETPPPEKAARTVAFATATTIMDADGRQNPFAGSVGVLDMQGNKRSIYPYPANAELFTNAMLWLAGEDEMIAVSPAAHEPRRIKYIKAGQRDWIRWLVWAGWPLVIVIAGIVVYVVRSRVR
jgi:ABC-type uncharacterized transport system